MNFSSYGKQKDFGKYPELLDIHVARLVEAHRHATTYMANTEMLRSGLIMYGNFMMDRVSEIALEIGMSRVKDGRCPETKINKGDKSEKVLLKIRDIVKDLFLERVHKEVLFCIDDRSYKQHLHIRPDDEDEQKVFHSDTFFHCVKFWYFPEKVTTGAFWYVPDSVVLKPELVEWHKDRIADIKAGKIDTWRGYGHMQGSLRISPEELYQLGYKPAPVEVEADTLVIANTHGFHKRGDVTEPVHRFSLHGQVRIDNPFA